MACGTNVIIVTEGIILTIEDCIHNLKKLIVDVAAQIIEMKLVVSDWCHFLAVASFLEFHSVLFLSYFCRKKSK